MLKVLIFFFFIFSGIFFPETSYGYQQKNAVQSLSKEKKADSEKRCIKEINLVRQKHALNLLKRWSSLTHCARGHSKNMANHECPFSHDGFDERFETIKSKEKISSFGENLAYSFGYQDPVKIAVEGWMQSPGHKKNILGHYDRTGVGVAIGEDGKFYITQLFAKKREIQTVEKSKKVVRFK